MADEQATQPGEIGIEAAGPAGAGEPSLAPPLPADGTIPPPPGYGLEPPSPYSGQVPPPPAWAAPFAPVEPRRSTVGLVGTILGGLAMLLACAGPAAFASWFVAVPAIVLGIVGLARKQDRNGLPAAALSMGIAAVVLSIVVFVVSITFLVRQGAGDDGYSDSESGIYLDSDAVASEDVTITETAVLQTGEDWYYLVMVTNTSETDAWTRLYADVVIDDVDGNLLASELGSASLEPGQTGVMYGALYDVGDQTPGSVEARIDDTASWAGSGLDGELSAELGGVTQDDWSSTLAGTVTSTASTDLDYVEVTAVVRDASGVPVAVYSGYADQVPAGGSSDFTVTLWDFAFEDDMSIELYPAW